MASFSPLSGLVVLDLTRLFPGPLCTLLLAGLGAEVWKVEDRQRGDMMRAYPPFVNGRSVLFESVNRGKLGAVVDLSSPAGREVLFRLAGRADVLVEGFKPGLTARLGIDHGSIRAAHPSLIYCSITGFGHTGPDASRGGHDLTYLARTGCTPGDPPVVPPLLAADVLGGAFSALTAILAALIERGRSGRGRFLDISITDGLLFARMLDVATGRLADADPNACLAGRLLKGGLPTYRHYRTADGGWVAVGILEPGHWVRFCRLAGRPDLEAAFRLDPDGMDDLGRELATTIGRRTTAEWSSLLAGADCCCEVVRDLEQALSDPHFATRDLFCDLPGGLRLPALPFVADGLRPQVAGRAPERGEHTDRLLAAAGFGADEIARLRRGRAVE